MGNDQSIGALQFRVKTPLGLVVRCTRRYWRFIVTEKHPILAGCQGEIVETLQAPREIRESRKDPTVALFYRGGPDRWTCAVVKRENGTGYLITAYPTDAIKVGEVIWTRSK